MPGMSIGELCEIFGHYERLAEPGIFIWDSMGIIMVSDDESGKDSAPVSRIMINWNIELSGFITDEDLIDRGSLENAGITDLVYLGRACHHRHEVLSTVSDSAQIFRILIAF